MTNSIKSTRTSLGLTVHAQSSLLPVCLISRQFKAHLGYTSPPFNMSKLLQLLFPSCFGNLKQIRHPHSLCLELQVAAVQYSFRELTHLHVLSLPSWLLLFLGLSTHCSLLCIFCGKMFCSYSF